METLFVKHSVATLAGMKTASMLCYKYEGHKELKKAACEWNGILNKKGIGLRHLKKGTGAYLCLQEG